MPRDADAEVWLRFALARGLGCRARLALLHRFGRPDAVLGASWAALRASLDAEPATAMAQAGERTDWPELAAHLEWLDEPDNHLLTLADAAYPRSLLDLPDAPVALFVKGSPACLSHPALAVVGSRQATPQGLENAEAFATELSRCGYTIISGLARGNQRAAAERRLDDEATLSERSDQTVAARKMLGKRWTAEDKFRNHRPLRDNPVRKFAV